MCRHRSRLPLVLLLLTGITASTDSTATLTWSGTGSPCGSTLQACIGGAPPGEIIEVATNGPINEDLTIDKTLTVRAAAGFNPVLGGLRRVSLSNPNPLANTIVFEHFTLTQGWVSAVQISSGSFNVSLRDLTIQNTFNSRPEIEIRPAFPGGPFGTIVFEISGNRLTVPPNSQTSSTQVISVEGGDAASAKGTIRGNRIDHFDGDQGGAIGISNVVANLNVDVIANEIRGSNYNEGIQFFQYGDGVAQVRFLDNLVVGQNNVAGAPGAYVVVTDAGSATFEIVNNTGADGGHGILITGRDDLGGSWNGIVANNVVSGMSGLGIAINQPTLTSGTVENDHNLVFAVSSNSFTPGPGTLFSNPLFVGGGNYRLTGPSPARNSGNSARVPTVLTTDLDGNPRMVGRVDMGAYESSSTLGSAPTLPVTHRLDPSVPNPFHVSTTIRYELSRPERVRLRVFDLQGRVVRWLVPDTPQEATRHVSAWDGRDANGLSMPSGVYLLRLEAGRFSATHRILLLR